MKKQHPDAIVTPMIVPYGTDSNGFRPRGVKSYGFTPAILPADVGRLDARRRRVSCPSTRSARRSGSSSTRSSRRLQAVSRCRALDQAAGWLSVCVLGGILSPVPCALANWQRNPAGRLSLDDVLARAGGYAIDYGLALTSVLAEETYTQRLVWRETETDLQERRLRSEIAFVRLADSTEWLAFRNVLAVDDAPVRRLRRAGSSACFRRPTASLLAQARLIAGESARHNLGPITREINVPTTALHFVHPAHRPNCRFDKEARRSSSPASSVDRRLQGAGPGQPDQPGRRQEPSRRGPPLDRAGDGRIVRSELVVKDFVRGRGGSKAVIHVTWRRMCRSTCGCRSRCASTTRDPGRRCRRRSSANATTSTASRRTPTTGASRSISGSVARGPGSRSQGQTR